MIVITGIIENISSDCVVAKSLTENSVFYVFRENENTEIKVEIEKRKNIVLIYSRFKLTEEEKKKIIELIGKESVVLQ